MTIIRYYLYSFLVAICVMAFPIVAIGLFTFPSYQSRPLLTLCLAIAPVTILFLLTNGNLLAAKLFSAIGLHGLAERCYLNQIAVEKLRCHPDEFRIDFAGRDVADFYLSIGEVEKAMKSTWSIFDWKDANSRRSDPEHTQEAFSFCRKLIAGGYQKSAHYFLQNVVQRRKKDFGEHHPSVGEAYLHLGNSFAVCDAEFARAAYESSLPCFYRPLLEMQEMGSVYLKGKRLKSEIFYWRVMAFSNLACLAYKQGDLEASSSYLDKCICELQQNEIRDLLLANCRDLVLAQRAQILIDMDQSDDLPDLYGSFKRIAPSDLKVSGALKAAKRNIQLLNERYSLFALLCYRPLFFLLEPLGGFWTAWLSPVALIAAHRD